MAPTVTWRARTEPRDRKKADNTLAACVKAASSAEFADFVTMEIWTGRHTSTSDDRNHATARVKTIVQLQDGTHQVAHVILDENFAYRGHELYSRIKNDVKGLAP